MLALGLGWQVLGSPLFLQKQMHRVFSLFLLFLSALFQRTILVSDYFPQNNSALSPLLYSGGYCPAGSSAVTSCPAGVIEWDAHLPLLSLFAIVVLVVDLLSCVLCLLTRCTLQRDRSLLRFGFWCGLSCVLAFYSPISLLCASPFSASFSCLLS